MSYGGITNPQLALRWALVEARMSMGVSLSEIELPVAAKIRVAVTDPRSNDLRAGVHYMLFKLWPLLDAKQRRRAIEIRRTKFDDVTHLLLAQLVYEVAQGARKRFQAIRTLSPSGNRRLLPQDRQRALVVARLAAATGALISGRSGVRRRRFLGAQGPFGTSY
jgi:hypothetical protein